MTSKTSHTTKNRILDVAENLFSEKGFDGVSLRQITIEADVNIAAVHYHFGVREELVRAVFQRRILPIQQERINRLDQLLAASTDAQPSLEDALEAFIRPAYDEAHSANGNGSAYRRLMFRVHSERGQWKEIYNQEVSEVRKRYMNVLVQILDRIPQEIVFWRAHFFIGSFIQGLIAGEDLDMISGGALSETGEDPVKMLIDFAAAGFRAGYYED